MDLIIAIAEISTLAIVAWLWGRGKSEREIKAAMFERGCEMDIEKGSRIKLIRMDDPYPVNPGTMGTCLGTDEKMGVAYIEWDDGRTLNLVPDVDKYEIIKEA